MKEGYDADYVFMYGLMIIMGLAFIVFIFMFFSGNVNKTYDYEICCEKSNGLYSVDDYECLITNPRGHYEEYKIYLGENNTECKLILKVR